MVIVGRIALPLGTCTKAVGAGGTIGTDSAMHHHLVALGFRDFSKRAREAGIPRQRIEIGANLADFLAGTERKSGWLIHTVRPHRAGRGVRPARIRRMTVADEAHSRSAE